MLKCLIVCLIAVLVPLSSLAPPAQYEDIGSTAIPDTPAGHQLARLFEALESGNHAAFIKTHFTKEFLAHFPMDDHLRFFREVSAMHGSFTTHTIERSSDTEIVVIAKGTKSGQWRRIDLVTESSAPYKIAGFGIDMADDPTSPEEHIILENFDDLDAYLSHETGQNRFSGVVFIAKAEVPVYQKAYGLASKRFQVPNAIDTKFNIGSINKIFTTVAIYQLMEQGKLSFDDTIGKYLTGFPKNVAGAVTIRHLLNHESGWGVYCENEYYRNHWADLRSIDDYMVFIKDIPLDFEPGARQRYSNTGYEVLGAIIEKVSGMSYYDYVRENIYTPAGMNNSDSYEMDDPVQNLAIGYMGPDYNRENTFSHSVKGTAAGGGYSTVHDLFAFTLALHNNTLLSKEHSSRFRGMGIAGGAPGISACLEGDVNGYTIIVLSNVEPPIAEKMARKITKLVRGMGAGD